MVNPIYKWTLAANGGQETQVYPVYKDDLAKEYEKQTGQEFFRAKLSGKLTFIRDDYDFIVAQSFDTEFIVRIYVSYDTGQTWTEYWKGNFWKTSCTFNADDQNLTVTPDVLDRYTDVLNGMEKEFDLIELSPIIKPLVVDKRPMIQVYVPGQSVISCFLSGMYWEQDCNVVEESDTVTIEGQDYPALTHKYFFALNKSVTTVDISGGVPADLPPVFFKDGEPSTNMTMASGEYEFKLVTESLGQAGFRVDYQLSKNGVLMWRNLTSGAAPPTFPVEVVLTPVEGSGTSGNVTAFIHGINVYARYVLDVDEIRGTATKDIPEDDICEYNRNYRKCIGYGVQDVIRFYYGFSLTPTKWGLYKDDLYYTPPLSILHPMYYPIAKATWGALSIWFAFSVYDSDMQGRKSYELRDTFPLYSVIAVLLGQIAPDLTHEGTTDYSAFLYGPDPLYGVDRQYFITPKSNVIHAGYDQPAQKAPVTLKTVLDMLRDCFRCYWFIDDDGRFRIEHILYFMRGGRYRGEPSVGVDLTTEGVTRTGKKWAFATSSYQYDKPEMAARYQFGWMDDVTQLFDGNPLEIVSKYVKQDNVEQVDVEKFTSDIDYILLNPSEISNDGFVLLSGVPLSYRLSANAVAGTAFVKDYDVNIQAGHTFTVKVTAASGIFLDGYLSLLLDDGASGVVSVVEVGETVSITTTQGARKLTFYRAANGVLASGSVSISVDSPADYRVPYVGFTVGGVDYELQNGYCAFVYLQNYYRWDMPAWTYKKDGVQVTALGIKKLKTQTLKFPAYTDPNTLELIKTNLGDGTIQKTSINLSNRNANTTLRYDTEQ